ncbi:MAG: LPS export ABC transporter periplasmic protein LptC [Betaproteobacteria bacterium]|nr:LPS export ABC transporter periplasmic protein LptC [Betaproteobacteria bacterium]
MMRGATNRMFPLALMLALALLTFWLDRAVREEQLHPSLKRHDPDFIVDNFTITRYDAEGRVESTLTARKMRHFPDDETTELEAPLVVQTKPDKARMTLTSERGALSQDGVDVFLYDNVLLVRDAKDEAPEQRMTTSFLHIVRGKSLVRTDRDVLIHQEDKELSGRGMEYDNETGQMSLRERVRGRFDPKKKEE